MQLTRSIVALCVLVASASPTRAQDSVSLVQGLPGDAVDAHAGNEQINDFVVDQTILRSSWDTVFAVAPLIKLSRERDFNPEFFTTLTGAQGISRLTASGVPFLRSTYSVWTAQGSGVNDNPALNDPGSAVDTLELTGYRFAVACAEFSTGTTDPVGLNASLNNVIGGVVNFESSLPSRLYVSRVVGATNSPGDGCNLSQYGMGSVGEDGSVHFRADAGNAACGGFTPLAGNNLFRIRLADRSAVTNVISNTGGVDAFATDWLLPHGSTTVWNAPNQIPTSIAGAPVAIGSTFTKQYLWEAAAGTLTAAASPHFAGGVTDHRGAVAYSPHDFPALLGASAAGTGAILARSGGSLTETLDLWGLASDGSVTGTLAHTLPAVVSDPCETWSSSDVTGTQEFDHYHAQTAFRGGSSQVALGKDRSGNLLAAATVYYGTTTVPSSNLNPNNYIAVLRIDPAGNADWSVAAWTEEASPVSTGKTVFHNGTTPIGTLTGAYFGPALSAPMIDSVGNVWFLAEMELLADPGVATVGLVRAVYDEGNFCYTLELVLKEGDVFDGRNSATQYQIDYLQITDSDSVASGTAFSGNISAGAFKNADPTTLDVTDARTLGGLVVAAGIIYDVDHDGQFVRSTGPDGVPGSPDEDYQVLLYLAASIDCNANGIPDDKDIFDGTDTDFDANGVPDGCEGVIGAPFCFGDGLDPFVTTFCPCSNLGAPGHGCANSVETAGALLTGTGTLSPDTVQLTISQVPPSVGTIYLQGDTLIAAGVVFGDGVRCAGGQLKRLGLKVDTDFDGITTLGPASGDPQISVTGGVTPGNTYYYQTYYRNPAPGFCPTATFNISNGMRIVW